MLTRRFHCAVQFCLPAQFLNAIKGKGRPPNHLWARKDKAKVPNADTKLSVCSPILLAGTLPQGHKGKGRPTHYPRKDKAKAPNADTKLSPAQRELSYSSGSSGTLHLHPRILPRLNPSPQLCVFVKRLQMCVCMFKYMYAPKAHSSAFLSSVCRCVCARLSMYIVSIFMYNMHASASTHWCQCAVHLSE